MRVISYLAILIRQVGKLQYKPAPELTKMDTSLCRIDYRRKPWKGMETDHQTLFGSIHCLVFPAPKPKSKNNFF